MEKYAIYSYTLKEKPRRDELPAFEKVPHVEELSLEQRFELLFGEKPGADLPVQKIRRGGADKYPCHVVRHEDNVVLLRLDKKKDVSIWEELPATGSPLSKIEKTTIKSTPYCYIIIDNRPDVRLIAIQSNSAAWRNPNDVKDLLQESMNWLLTTVYNFGVDVTIQTKMLPTKFWEYVDRRRKKEDVKIRSMTFSFANHKRRTDIDIKSALSSEWKHLESFMSWIDGLGGDRGEISVVPPKGGELMTRKRLADIKHMIEICLNSNYSLSVTFSDGVTYKCNENMRAEIPMEDETIREEFESGWKKFFTPYNLMIWLDNVLESIKKYEDVEEIKPKPGRKDEKQVS